MPSDIEIIRFLEERRALRLGASPWPTVSEQDETFPIIERDLFPPGLDLRTDQDNVAFDFDPLLQRLPDDLIVFCDDLLSDDGYQSPAVVAPDDSNGNSLDVLAWYQPIHFFGIDWGIYIKREAILDMAKAIGKFHPSSLRSIQYRSRRSIPYMNSYMLASALRRAAFSVLFLHEQYHHKVECFSIRMHVVEKKPRFVPYHEKVYAPNKNQKNQLEESLAEAECYLRLGEERFRKALGPAVLDATRRYVKSEMIPLAPDGYRQAEDYLSQEEFDVGEEILQTRIQTSSLSVPPTPRSWNLATHMMQSMFSVNSNIWEIVSQGSDPLMSDPPIAPLALPSTRDAERLLRRLGWEYDRGRGKGSHRWWSKEGSQICLPNRRERLSRKVADDIAKALGIRLGDLAQLI